MTSLDHFLLTRFAVRIREGAPAPSAEWIKSRLVMFERICLPSVLAQTSNDFRWLLFVDGAVELGIVNSLRALLPPHAEIVRVRGVCERGVIASEVRARVSTSQVITSRVDNDDALHPTFIAKARQRLQGEQHAFLNFRRGYQYSRRRLLAYSHPSNAFISLVERSDAAELTTVFADWHVRLNKYGRIIQDSSTRMWVQNCHGGNVKNQERGLRVNHRLPSRSFPYLELKAQNPFEITLDFISTVMNVVRSLAKKPTALRRLLGKA